MKLLILLLLPIGILSQPPNFNGNPPIAPPGLNLPCWPPPCVSIGDYLAASLIISAVILSTKLNKQL